MLTALAKAVAIEPIKAKDDPKNTGLFFCVKNKYTIVPIPAPNKAAAVDILLPIIRGTAMVAAIIASNC